MRKCDNFFIRVSDVFLSSVSLIVFSPLFIVVSIVLRITGEGEIFYIQQRVGKNFEKIGLIKFATMLKDSPNIATGTLTVDNDPRVLPFGKILRWTKINELPQLLNVLLGDLSLIGPRPLTADTFKMYSKEGQLAIAYVKPGLSGLGSIVFRDEARLLKNRSEPREYYARVISPSKEKIETWFIQNRTLYNYYRLVFATIFVVALPRLDILKSFGLKGTISSLLHEELRDE